MKSQIPLTSALAHLGLSIEIFERFEKEADVCPKEDRGVLNPSVEDLNDAEEKRQISEIMKMEDESEVNHEIVSPMMRQAFQRDFGDETEFADDGLEEVENFIPVMG